MSRYGIIDLGSNTIRLCIYEVACPPGAPISKKDLNTLLNYKVMAGLASHVQDGAMTHDGVRKAVKTINEHLTRAAHFDCTRIDVFATAVLRNCKNSRAAAAAIEQGIDARITILSNEEEAHLGFLGASMATPIKTGTMVDIGGGSTELTNIQDGLDLDKTSLPQGSLSSFAEQVKGVLPTNAEVKSIRRAFRTLAHKRVSAFAAKELYGIGGAIRSAAKVYGDVLNGGERLGYLEPAHLRALFERYEDDPDAFAHEALHTVPDRIHTFLPGCALIEEIFALTGASRLTVCKLGVREGYLAERVLVRPISRERV